MSYAGPPSCLVEVAEHDPRKQTTDISNAMRLIARFAEFVQGQDAVSRGLYEQLRTLRREGGRK